MDSGKFNFNNHFCDRTKRFALSTCKLLESFPLTISSKPLINQLVRSSTSVAANFRAASRARSSAEYYSKICIVVEEIDESVFWIELLEELNFGQTENLIECKTEAVELLKVFSTTKKTLKNNLKK